MAASFLVFFQMQQIAMDIVVRPTISAAIATIVATNRPMLSVVNVGSEHSWVTKGTETYMEREQVSTEADQVTE